MRKTVLVVDDTLISRVCLKKILEANYDVLEADDGDTCLQLLEEKRDKISLIILDVWMPRMDGFAVLRELEERKWQEHLPVIVATADKSEESEMKLLYLGAVEVLHKPYDTDAVLRKAKAVIYRQEKLNKIAAMGQDLSVLQGKNLLNCMGSFIYEYNHANKSERMDPYYVKYLAKEWNTFSITDPTKSKSLVYRPDYPKYEMFFQQPNTDNYATVDVRLMAANGRYEWFRLGMTQYESAGAKRTAVTFHNVSAERKAQARLEFLASHDPLTQIYNQQAFSERVNSLLEKNPQEHFSMLHLALDRFSIMNQLYGKAEEDQALRYMAVKLQEIVESAPMSVCCHLYAEHFAVFGIYDKEKVNELITDLQEALNLYPLKFQLVASAGVYQLDNTVLSIESMLDRTEKAQKNVSNNYGKHIAWYDDNMRQKDETERLIVMEMGDALRQGQFVMFLQPKCDMRTDGIIGSEALVRWQHPTHGMISPGKFIPVMEGNGFISQLDYYILEQACIQQRRWLDAKKPVYPISVNVSRADLYNTQLLKDILKIVDDYAVPHNLIEFELTESSFVFDNAKLSELSTALQKHGFRVLMDDFGSGYSSLNTLKDIYVDVLKIDLKFLRDSDKNTRALSIMKFVVQMAKELQIETIVEGVETLDQVEFLKQIGVINAQGFYYYRPMPVDSFEAIVNKGQKAVN